MYYTTTFLTPHTIALSIGINTVQKNDRWVRDPPKYNNRLDLGFHSKIKTIVDDLLVGRRDFNRFDQHLAVRSINRIRIARCATLICIESPRILPQVIGDRIHLKH